MCWENNVSKWRSREREMHLKMATWPNQIHHLGLLVFHHLLCSVTSVWLFVTLWTIAHEALLSKGFSRQEYWSGLPCPPPGDLHDLGIESKSVTSPALAGGLFTASATWEAWAKCCKFSHFRLHPTPLGCYRAPSWVPWVIQQIPIGYLFYTW